jgi:RNA polymerase sigma-70 factor (ECF subfamily)
MSDEELLLRYRDLDDVEAFEALVRRYEKPIYSFLVRYLGNTALAEDVFQATFLRVHEKSHLFTEGHSVRPWLYSVATHQAIDALRKERKYQIIRMDEDHAAQDGSEGSLLELLQSTIPTPTEVASEHERAEWLRGAVNALPDHQRIAVLLVFFQGLKYQEAAEALHLPVGTIKSRLHKALLTLNTAWRSEHRGE